jgi:energy-coupling factor transporter ATP-binding protein EcfA2
MTYSPWTKIDSGREGLWEPDVWMGVIAIIGAHEGEDVYDENSPIYDELERKMPGRGWKKYDEKNGIREFRPLFRDYAKPWLLTDTISLDNQRFSLTSDGRKLLDGSIDPQYVFSKLLQSYQEKNDTSGTYERPFTVLASAFLEAARTLSFNDLYFGVMLRYRPGDSLAEALTAARQVEERHTDTAERRLKLLLRIMVLTGAIAPTDKGWTQWNVDLLRSIAGVKGLGAASATDLSSIISSFEADLTASGIGIDKDLLRRLIAALLSKRFLILTGLSGSGKTKIAQMLARWLSGSTISSDPFYSGAVIQSDKVNYHVKNSDRCSVEFANGADPDATRVMLPREMINEWARYIVGNNISRETPARVIREEVKKVSTYSDQLHSFETHLKAAAFASIEAEATPRVPRTYELIPVGADWTTNENILGYPSALDERAYVSRPAHRVMRSAVQHSDVPHFIILDEMNLSHVERYFADLLSAMESSEGIPLYEGADRFSDGQVVPNRQHIPRNLFIIGTVNVDETTYMFSPKVLDRANVIEFRVTREEMTKFISNPVPIDLDEINGKGVRFNKLFVAAANAAVQSSPDVQSKFEKESSRFFVALKSHGGEFGYRTAFEAARFVHYYQALGTLDSENWFDDAFDAVILQKFLPKLHGSRARLAPVLTALWLLCVEPRIGAADPHSDDSGSANKSIEPSAKTPEAARFPRSAEKIYKLWKLVRENGFASFSEA